MTDTCFSPSFGNKPQVMVGRENEKQRLVNGLMTKPGSKERAQIIIGQRGLGKTVLMLEMINDAKEKGYIVASPTIAKKGCEHKILEKLLDEGETVFRKGRRTVTGGTLGAFGISLGIDTERTKEETRSFRARLSDLCREASRTNKGILIMLDEVQNNEYMEEVASAYQELVGEGCNIAIIMAGLPSTVSAVLNNRVLTFLARASRLELEPIKYADIDAYYYRCFREMGISLREEQIREAAVQTQGSPYLMQLIGHYITLLAENSGMISEEAYEHAVSTAKQEYMTDLCQIALHGISSKDFSFLQAMTRDAGASSIAAIAERMGVSTAYAQTYKRRMIEAGLIEQSERGKVKFAVPMLDQYLMTMGK